MTQKQRPETAATPSAGSDNARSPEPETSSSPGPETQELGEPGPITAEETRGLRARHVELEAQNKDLRNTVAGLEQSTAHGVDLFDSAPVAYCTLSEQGLILEANLKAAKLLDVTRDELVGQRLADFICEEDWHSCDLFRRQLLHKDEPRCCDVRLVKQGGEIVWAHLVGAVARDGAGATVCRLALYDISERKRANAALRASEEKRRSQLETIPDPVFTCTREGRYTYANKAFAEAVGKPLDEVIGRSIPEIFSPDLAAERMAALDHVVRTGVAAVTELSLPYAGRYYQTTFAPVRNDEDEVVSVIGSSKDVTERKRAEEKYSTLFREMLDGFAVHEMICDASGSPVDFRYLAVNPAFEQMTGLKAAAIVGRTVLEVRPETERECIDALGKVALSGEPYYFRSQSSETGKHFDVHAFRPAPNESACLYVDVTERDKALEALQLSHRDDVVRRSIAEVFLTTPAEDMFGKVLQIILDAMECEHGIFGYIDEQGTLVVRSMTPDVWQDCQMPDKTIRCSRDAMETDGSPWARAIRQKASFMENEPRRVPEDYLPIENVLAVPVLFADETTGILTVANRTGGFTERQQQWLEQIAQFIAPVLHARLERDSRTAERERLLSAIEQAGEAVLITDADGTIRYVNPAFETNTGYTRQEALGQDPRLLKSGEHDEAFYRNMWNTISGGETWKGRLVNKRKDGTLFTEAATISPVFNDVGRIVNYVAVKRDISKRLELEAQFLQAQKMEPVGRLAGGVAHDFNNALTLIIGYTELALDKAEASDPLHADLEAILQAAVRAANIPRQLLAIARKQTVAPVVLDLNATVESLLKMMRSLIGEDIDLAWLPAAGLWPVRIDPTQVDQILANLCVNARDAISDVGKVTIETANVVFDELYCAEHRGFVAGEFVMLAVSDNGCGMDKDVLGHVFEPFFTTKEHGKGTGLGLPTVYGIVKQNEGFINAYSEPGQGTTIRIYLPRQGSEIDAPEKNGETEILLARGETVLLVEDETSILEIGKRILEKLGYHVLIADTPGQAMRMAEEHVGEIHLLITDVVMPEMNGRDLAERLTVRRPGLRTLFTSGYTDDVIARHGILSEGVQFIQKPFSMKGLAAKVYEVLDRDRKE